MVVMHSHITVPSPIITGNGIVFLYKSAGADMPIPLPLQTARALPNIKPVIALAAQLYSPSSRWSLRSIRWHHHPSCAGFCPMQCHGTLPVLRWRSCPRCTGIPTSILLASSPFTRWRRYLRHAGIIALVTLASSHWRCCLQHIVIAALAICWRCIGILVSIAPALSPFFAGALPPALR